MQHPSIASLHGATPAAIVPAGVVPAVGPTIVGWIADGPGGLARGLVFSALALWVGAALAWRQRTLAPAA